MRGLAGRVADDLEPGAAGAGGGSEGGGRSLGRKASSDTSRVGYQGEIL